MQGKNREVAGGTLGSSDSFVKEGGLDVFEAGEGASDRTLKMMNRNEFIIPFNKYSLSTSNESRHARHYVFVRDTA
jgi:hypothetical protein